MHTFEYLKPKSIDEAISLMESHGERARYIAGGTDILVKIKEKKVLPDFLISLRHIPEMAYIHCEEARGIFRIGSMTTHRMLEKSPLIRRRYPILSDAVDNIGSVQIRNVATIGGNIVNAVPSADGQGQNPQIRRRPRRGAGNQPHAFRRANLWGRLYGCRVWVDGAVDLE